MATKEDIARLKRKETKGLTPEEEELRKQREADAKAFIQARERKLAGEGGVPSPRQREQATKDVIAEEKAQAELTEQAEQAEQAKQTLQTPQELEPTLIQKQFEAEGGFQELEGRGERAIERVAEVGLIPAKVGGDIILSGLEKFTGKKYGRQTTAELAETDFGKLLGVSTAAVAAATLIGVAGAATAGAVGTVTGQLAVSLGVSKGVVAGVGILGIGTITGLSKDVIIDKILDRKETNEIISAITTIGATSGAIEGTYMAGGYGNNPGKAIAELQQLNNDLLIAEYQIQQAVILDERVKQSGELINIMADLQEQRLDIVERTTLILQAIPEYNPTQILEQIEIFKDIRDNNRQDLIDKGIIREAII